MMTWYPACPPGAPAFVSSPSRIMRSILDCREEEAPGSVFTPEPPAAPEFRAEASRLEGRPFEEAAVPEVEESPRSVMFLPPPGDGHRVIVFCEIIRH